VLLVAVLPPIAAAAAASAAQSLAIDKPMPLLPPVIMTCTHDDSFVFLSTFFVRAFFGLRYNNKANAGIERSAMGTAAATSNNKAGRAKMPARMTVKGTIGNCFCVVLCCAVLVPRSQILCISDMESIISICKFYKMFRLFLYVRKLSHVVLKYYQKVPCCAMLRCS